MRTFLAVVVTVVVSSGIAAAQTSRPAPKSAEARLQAIEDKDAIHAVMMNYGRTLDARDFAGFAELFARDAEYVAGASSAKGPGGHPGASRRLAEEERGADTRAGFPSLLQRDD